jgi:hypothetical protein
VVVTWPEPPQSIIGLVTPLHSGGGWFAGELDGAGFSSLLCVLAVGFDWVGQKMLL